MKINRLETHDRLEYFKRDQEINIAKGAEDCLKINPLSLALQEKSPYVYLFAHPRTSDDGVTKRMIWQPRLTRPTPQTNSYLFRAISKTDLVDIIWLIPPKETWKQFEKGKVTENEVVDWSINIFQNNRETLEASHPEDLSDGACKHIYRQIALEMNQDKILKQLYVNSMPENEEAFLTF